MSEVTLDDFQKVYEDNKNILIIGRPGTGKTSLILNGIKNIDKEKILFCTYDLPEVKIIEKIDDNVKILNKPLINEIEQEVLESSIKVIIIDYIQLLEIKNSLSKKDALEELLKISKDNIKLLVISQLSENSEIKEIYANYFDEIVLLPGK